MLTFSDVAHLFPDGKGIKGISLNFQTITTNSTLKVEKGLFIYLDDEERLLDAISNGAIAAIWPASKTLPSYTPNHFPVFLVDDVIEALRLLVQTYASKISIENCGDLTTMKLENKEMKKLKINQLEVREFLKAMHKGGDNGWSK
ncbi:hypothetical protein [Bacillus sp. FJAT-50079]|uniref:hypothetical protein n=1 Tax=Bacillus sp. FJAT-50079 TaxID=2833577 RepID=UPI001BC9D7A8|nr:hypothetical protein [Bacillus sp. FJAT-50079]MBS4207714.1 hypothetical protein [Bacillus sp. FJAT-50079]